MLPVIQIGPLALQTPGLLILMAIGLGLSASERFAPRFSLDSNQLYNLVLVSLLAGIIGARLAYAVQFRSIFFSSPLNLFSLSPTMLNGEAGLVIGALAGFIYAQRKSMPLWSTLDALTPGGSIFMIFFHLAHFASGDAFGSPAQMPLSIELWGQLRHPVQLYEMAAAILIAGALLPRVKGFNQPGLIFWSFLALSSFARLFFEYFRGDSTTIFGNIHLAQVIAWIVLGVSLWQLGGLRQANLESIPPSSKNGEDLNF